MTFFEEKTDSFESSDGKTLFYRRLIPGKERLRIVVSHGLGEHSGRYRHVADALFPLGASFWIHDHRGHGRSQGKKGHINNFNEYVNDLKTLLDMAAVHGGNRLPTILLGHSMGGLIALSLARQYPENIDGLIVSSPLLGLNPLPPLILRAMARGLSFIFPALPLSNKLDPKFISHDREQVRAYVESEWVHDKISARWFVRCMSEIQKTRETPQAIKVPFLMQISGDDRLVDPKASMVYFDTLTVSDKTLCHYESLYHEIYNEKLPDREKVLEDLRQWIGEHFL